MIRLSGPRALEFGQIISGRKLAERAASFAYFKGSDAQLIDSGLAIFFAGPKSFTGEDVVELQGHGGPVIQDMLLSELIRLGARQARGGEFSQRAFLNNKIDLAQAEAIADLIDSSTREAAQAAMRSLQGAFSEKIHQLLKELIDLRVYVEAAIDFPEEEIDFLAEKKISDRIQSLKTRLLETIAAAGHGAILRDGLRVVIAGKPNAGKSSLLNALAGQDAAIVTEVPGTTRDSITQTINIDGLAVHIIDTAGLRDSDDEVEKIGIARAHREIQQADLVLYVVDASEDLAPLDNLPVANATVVYNKIDLVAGKVFAGVAISAKRGDGLAELRSHIRQQAGLEGKTGSLFTARRRHLTALTNASDAVSRGLEQIKFHNAGELLADELLQAQHELNKITGEFSADDLLGEIFAGFCIGK